MQTLPRPRQHIKVNRGIVDHHGVVDRWEGDVLIVAELAKPGDGGRVRFVTLDQFSNGMPIEVVHHADGLPLEQVRANIRRAASARSYHLVNWNCEHFATWCCTHVARSMQVESAAAAVGIGAFIVLLLKLAA